MSLSSWRVSGKWIKLDNGKLTGAKAGAAAVLLSYPILAGILFFTIPLVLFIVPKIIDTEPLFGNTGLLYSSFIFSIGGMVTAFLLTVWVAMPFGSLIGAIVSIRGDNSNYKAMSLGTFIRGLVFSMLIGMAAFIVSRYSYLVSSFATNDFAIACAVLSILVANIVWLFIMSNGEDKFKGKTAGFITGFVSLALTGPAATVIVTISEYQSFNEITFKIGATVFTASLISFFAILLCGVFAVPVSTLIGFIVAKNDNENFKEYIGFKGIIKQYYKRQA